MDENPWWRIWNAHRWKSMVVIAESPRMKIHGGDNWKPIDRKSMGISDSPSWIFIYEPLFQIHHHRFSSMGISDSPPGIFILGLWSVFTTIDFHLWAFQIYHHHRFSSMGFQLSPSWIFILRLLVIKVVFF